MLEQALDNGTPLGKFGSMVHIECSAPPWRCSAAGAGGAATRVASSSACAAAACAAASRGAAAAASARHLLLNREIGEILAVCVATGSSFTSPVFALK